MVMLMTEKLKFRMCGHVVRFCCDEMIGASGGFDLCLHGYLVLIL